MNDTTSNPEKKARKKKALHYDVRFEMKFAKEWAEEVEREAQSLGMSMAAFIRMAVNNQVRRLRAEREKELR